MRVPELLAPAGGPDAFLAAMAAGADAVYLGLSSYSARAAAEGFTLGDLERAARMARERGARVYVAMNVLLHEGELAGALATARAALEAGADALIVADTGFCRLLADEVPAGELHLSTQAGALAPEAARLAARELGCTRVTCGRELSVREIADMAGTGVDVECFVHGAICVCYAGACGYSAARRGRSANQGGCTQPCRMDYALVDGAGTCLAGNASFAARGCASAGKGRAGARRAVDIVGAGEKLLSPRDFLGLRHVAALAEAGVASLKIEGRMKNPDYVYNVVSCYRRALDALAAGDPLGPDELGELEARLTHSFNRGFTDAYLAGERADARLMGFERAINQGVRVGEVVARGRDEVTVAFSAAVAAGDMLEIRSVPGPDAPADIPRRWPMVPAPALARSGDVLPVRCKRKVEVGSPVHLTRDTALVARAAAAVDGLRAEWAGFGDAAGCHEGATCERAVGAYPKAGVVATPGTQHDAAVLGGAQLGVSDLDGTLGRTCRAAQGLGGAARGASVLDGFVCIAPAGIDVRGVAAVQAGELAACGISSQAGEARGREVPALPMSAEPLSAARLVRRPGAARPGDYVEAWRVREDPGAWEHVLPGLTLVLDEVYRPGDASDVLAWARAAAGVACRNLGQLDLVRGLGIPFEVAEPLNVWNAGAARWLAHLGARRVWLPAELTAERVRALAAATCCEVPLGVLTRGPVQLMVTEHCLLSVEGPCSGACACCERRRAERALVERDGTRVDLSVDARGRTRLFSRAPRDWSVLEPGFLSRGILPLHIL